MIYKKEISHIHGDEAVQNYLNVFKAVRKEKRIPRSKIEFSV